MIWRIATPEDFANEDWEFEHYRYLDGTKLETQYWDVKDGYLQKKSGTGTLPFNEIQILDEEISTEQLLCDLIEWTAFNYQASINREENYVRWNIADTEQYQSTKTVINDFFDDNPKYK